MRLVIEAYKNIAHLHPAFPGVREVNPALVRKGHRVMSFGGGNLNDHENWLNKLAALAGAVTIANISPGKSLSYADCARGADEGPFLELILFSDFDGGIGPEIAAKLADDFKEFLPKAEASLSSDDLEMYQSWYEAFHQASQSGAVLVTAV